MRQIHSSTHLLSSLFSQAIQAAGLIPPDIVHIDGQLHRFSSSGKRGDLSGWYVLHGNRLPAGVFGCWRLGLTETWCSKPLYALTFAERNTLRQRVKEAKALHITDRQHRQQQAQIVAMKNWAMGLPVTQHPYLTAKGVKGYELRVKRDMLLAPLHDTSGVLHSVQSITSDGHKRFMAGGRVCGCYYGLGHPGSVWVLCEGVATAHSIHEATGLAVAAAFSASNLAPVAQALKRKFPGCNIILAADDDYLTDGNPGLTAARAAAMAAGGLVVMPQFSSTRPHKATDFNDLFVLAGSGAVRQCFAEVMEELSHDL